MCQPQETPRLSEEEQKQLYDEARKGDGTAFAKLHSAFEGALIGFILGRIHWIGVNEAVDIAQDVWIKVWKHMQDPTPKRVYDPEFSFYTFIIKFFAKNVIGDWKKKQKANKELSDALTQYQDALSSSSDDDDDAYRRFLGRLEMFRLTFLCGGYPHEQLAFAFAKGIYGIETEKGEIRANCETAYERHANTPLRKLLRYYLKAYKSKSEITDSK
ncbi:unnamed protein product, partial [marine sediment metagenome]